MPHHFPSPPPTICIEISAPLLAALQKLSASASLTREEQFEVAAITFMVARALAINKRAIANYGDVL
jgi:hypothetical protein